MRFDVAKIATTLSDNDENWQPRMKALVDLEKYVSKNGGNTQLLSKDFFKQLRIPMQKQLQDLRSSIVREACKAVTSIARSGGSYGCALIDFCLSNVIEVSAGANKVMATYATKCLMSTLRLCENGSKQVIHTLVDSACHSKNTKIRENAMEGICVVVENWKGLSESDGEEIFTALRSGYEDASAKTRAKAREAFWPYDTHFHESATTLLGIMDSRQKRTIMNIKPSVSSTSQGDTDTSGRLKVNTTLNKTMRIKPSDRSGVSNSSKNNKDVNHETQVKKTKHVVKIESPRVLTETETAIKDEENTFETDDEDEDGESIHQPRYQNNVTIMDDTLDLADLINETVEDGRVENGEALCSGSTEASNDKLGDDETMPLEKAAQLVQEATTNGTSQGDVDGMVVDDEVTFNSSKVAWSKSAADRDDAAPLNPLSRKETEKIMPETESKDGLSSNNRSSTSSVSGLIIKPSSPVHIHGDMSATEIGLNLLQKHRSHVDQVLEILRKEMEVLGQFEQKETIRATDVALYASQIADSMQERETLLESMYNLLGATCSSLK